VEDWSYSPSCPVEARDTYEAEILKDRLNLLPNYYEDGNFSSVLHRAYDVPASFTKDGRNISFRQLCENLDDSKSNAVIKKFLKILVPEIGDQNFDDAASKFHSIFIECQHVLWTRINKLFEDLQRRAK
ncbi:14072_t:CDS:2, partial [Cetraspora pellucida]